MRLEGESEEYYKKKFIWFPSRPESTFRGENFGISLCLWIRVHKRALIALSLLLLLFSHSFSLSPTFFSFSFGHRGEGPRSLIKWGETGSVCGRSGGMDGWGCGRTCQAQSSVIQSLQHPLRQLF